MAGHRSHRRGQEQEDEAHRPKIRGCVPQAPRQGSNRSGSFGSFFAVISDYLRFDLLFGVRFIVVQVFGEEDWEQLQCCHLEEVVHEQDQQASDLAQEAHHFHERKGIDNSHRYID